MTHASRRSLRPALLAALSIAAPVPSQTAWQDVTPLIVPAPRWNAAMAYDASRDRIVLWGGEDGTNLFGDTWEFDGASWAIRTGVQNPVGAPASMCFDRGRGRIVMVVWQGSGLTYEFDGVAWVLRPIASPPGSFRCPMVFDTSRGVCVLVGSGPAATTWEYDGVVWTQRTLPAAPPSRLFAGLAYDALRERTILHGGFDFAHQFDDTWEYDGTTWVQQLVVPGPARFGVAFAFDPPRRRAVLFGGYFAPAAGTFEYDTNGWLARSAATPPPPVGHATMVFDELRQRMVLFGGRDSATGVPRATTWVYRAIALATVANAGSGCGGTQVAAPVLLPHAHHVPYVGRTFGVQVASLPAGAPALVAFGTSDTQVGGSALPLALQVLGMPGCTLFTSAEILLAATPAGATADVAFPIPALAVLVGAEFFLQGFVVAPNANPAGLIATQSLACTIGAP